MNRGKGGIRLVGGIASAALMLLGGIPAAAAEHVSQADVYWWWDANTAVGTSQLVRTDQGISGVLRTSGIPSGQAVTLWFIVFNNPEGCSASPCAIPADVFNDAAEADFYFAGGHVVGQGGTTTFAGHLGVGQTKGSGKTELAAAGVAPLEAVPLSAPHDAEVVLALHTHGPALQGQDLVAQISSFLGGCDTFLGSDGFASGPGDLPAAPGECSTVQRSLHQ